jgi:hypothetical protein
MRFITTFATLLYAVALMPATAWTQEHFSSPEAAARALAAATRAGDSGKRLQAILGPQGEAIVSSGDPVDDAATRRRFATAAAAHTRIELANDGAMAIVHVGHDDWPFPIPLMHEANGWRFDAAAGKDELLNRRIGRNELITISVCRAYVDAQFEFAHRFHTFAQTLRSSPGKRDGLYWEASGRDRSPFGPLAAAATAEGYHVRESAEAPMPYHGYFFRVLTSQGPHAPGGARDYVQNGSMTGGFALVAWPAVHGSTGVMTFVVNRDGVVFQKNLGDRTDEVVKAMAAYDPDDSWDPVR